MNPRTTVLAFAVLCGIGGGLFLRSDRGDAAEFVAAAAPTETVGAIRASRAAAALDRAPATGGLAGLSETRATSPAAVREVLRLTRDATPEDRVALRRAALESDDALVAGNAAKALGRLKLFSSDPELLALLSDPRPRVRQDAAQACGADGREAAVPALIAASADADAACRTLIVAALGRIGGSEARDFVLRAANDPARSETERVFAREALRR